MKTPEHPYSQAEVKEGVSLIEKEQLQREEYCAGLEALAQFLRTNPQCKLPEQVNFIEYTWHKERVVEFAKTAGHVEKDYGEYYVAVLKHFGPINYGVRISRENVCERVVVGTKTIPGREAYIVPAEPAHEEEIVKWECTPLLALGEEKA